ncbi:hypothetical protein [Streptomyces sp. SID4982]|uniref:hypothetical protein n=1 Tax=Streptomyces sp. SID4982 TaxID=2690291 RepID=UPI0013710B63|nr:hypothetical protein [Streptomyces sp. SID4982]MYS13701.1 hypothetical protein [Streptomyces sp. SID4982]
MACERVPYASPWLVVDAGSFDLHTQAVAFLASLRARGCSPNTERAYAGRVVSGRHSGCYSRAGGAFT